MTLRCVVHDLPLRNRSHGHVSCPRWRECGSTSNVNAWRQLFVDKVDRLSDHARALWGTDSVDKKST